MRVNCLVKHNLQHFLRLERFAHASELGTCPSTSRRLVTRRTIGERIEIRIRNEDGFPCYVEGLLPRDYEYRLLRARCPSTFSSIAIELNLKSDR